MMTGQIVWIVLSGLWLIDSIWSLPASTLINCENPETHHLGSIPENYQGVVEILNVPGGADVFLETPSCPNCLSFLDLSYTVGTDTALVITKKPLDAEALNEPSGPVSSLSYSITCNRTWVRNNRTLVLTDINDNAPVFEKDEYIVNVSEATPVDTFVIEVKAFDADVSPLYHSVTYSIEPATTTFEIYPDGSIFLKERLNCTESKLYNLNVKARDIVGSSSETTVLVYVWKTEGPHFEYSTYDAMIHENKIGPFEAFHPAPIKASDGDKKIIYCIKKVSPEGYWANFAIDKETGVISVVKELNWENSSTLKVVVMASLEDDSLKTTHTTVVVTVEDVNEPPVFNSKKYTAETLNEVAEGYPVLQVKASDPDVGDTLQYTLVTPTSMFAVEPSSGQVYVVSVAGESGKVSLQVKTEDKGGLSDTTTVEVIITDSSQSVTISLNQPHDVVINNIPAMEEALEKALGFSVTIISVNEGNGDTSIKFIAKETSGNIVPAEDLKNELMSKKERVQTELAVVFGPDVDFDIVGNYSNTTMLIILGTVIPVAVIAIAATVAGVWKKTRIKRRGSNLSFHIGINFASMSSCDAGSDCGS